MKITICCSASFFKEANEIGKELEMLGFDVFLPLTAIKMAKSGNYDVKKVKTWFADKNDFSKKTRLIWKHFTEIEKADAILVINNKKHNVEGYIGGNTLIEMAIAFYLKKPIYILNNVTDKKFMLYEEIMALNPIFLNGDFSKIVRS